MDEKKSKEHLNMFDDINKDIEVEFQKYLIHIERMKNKKKNDTKRQKS